jgi:hypothetical protein
MDDSVPPIIDFLCENVKKSVSIRLYSVQRMFQYPARKGRSLNDGTTSTRTPRDRIEWLRVGGNWFLDLG